MVMVGCITLKYARAKAACLYDPVKTLANDPPLEDNPGDQGSYLIHSPSQGYVYQVDWYEVSIRCSVTGNVFDKQ